VRFCYRSALRWLAVLDRRRSSRRSRRSSSASRPAITSDCSVTSSMAARTRARLRSECGKRTVVWTVGSVASVRGRGGTAALLADGVIRVCDVGWIARVRLNRAYSFKASSSPERRCGRAVNIADPLTDFAIGRTLGTSSPHPSRGYAVDERLSCRAWAGPKGDRFCPMACAGYRTVQVQLMGGERCGDHRT
jgi:hypothetical protein